MNKNTKIVLAVMIIGAILILIPGRQAEGVRQSFKKGLAPITGLIYRSSASVRKTILVIRDLKAAPAENQELSSQIAQLLTENARLKEVDYENSLLRSELKLSSSQPNRKLVGGRIISRSTFSFLDVITIDRGTKDGIKADQPVTLNGALIGKIISVGSGTADVELITSSNAITQAQLQNSRVTGVIRGGIRGLVLDYVPQDTPVTPGETVVTSGLGGNLRAGLLIGTVIDVISKKNDVFQSISIKPAVNISRVDWVFVEI